MNHIGDKGQSFWPKQKKRIGKAENLKNSFGDEAKIFKEEH